MIKHLRFDRIDSIARDEAEQAEMDARKIDRILESYLESFDDCRDGELRITDMHLRNILKTTVESILQRHTAAAIEEIAGTLTDEIDALAQDRLTDLRTRIETKEGSE